MSEIAWPEAANRRLRALLWRGCSLREVAMRLDQPLVVVEERVRALGIRRPQVQPMVFRRA